MGQPRLPRASTSAKMGAEQGGDVLHDLEVKYRNASHEVEMVAKDEEARRLKLRIIMLRDENATLREGIEQKEASIGQLSESCHEIRTQLEQTTQKCQAQEKKLRTQARDQSTLKAELQSLDGVSEDSAKLLSEKLALSREVAVLKPEIEHMRSQLAHQADVLAEKLALERQLNALEVDLANEKRAAKRAAQKQGRDTDVEDELREQLREAEKKLAAAKRATKKGESGAEDPTSQDDAEELKELKGKLKEMEKLLAAEKKERQRLQKENDRIKTEAVERQDDLEKKLTRLKAKLHETQEELTQVRAGTQPPPEPQVEATTMMDVTTTTQLVPVKPASTGRKKRRAEEMTNDQSVIHTPNNTESRFKRPIKRRLEAFVGEKSTFSITPFLNKTVSQIEGTPKSATKTINLPVFQFRGADNSTEEAQVTETAPLVDTTRPLSPKRVRKAQPPAKLPKARGRPKKALAEAKSSAQNTAPAPVLRMPIADPTVEKDMADASDQENQGNRTTDVEVTTSLKPGALPKSKAASSRPSNASATSGTSEPEPKKKRRKLLGNGGGGNTTIFDDDDAGAEPVKRPAKVQLGGAAHPLSRVGKAAVRMGKNAFAGASFSPLKRDKRGVNASFLA